MIIEVSLELPVMPDWIFEKGTPDETLLGIWHMRADVHREIMEIEYLPCASPWKAQYRSVNCSGIESAL